MNLLVPLNSCRCRIASEYRKFVVLSGFFYRKNDGRKIQRYRCKNCKRSFSDASFSLCFGQKKRHLNPWILGLLAGCLSQRRSAILLRTNRKTIVRKFLFLGLHAKDFLRFTNGQMPKVKILEFDDLETFEHTMCKPLSVTLAVECKTRRILGFRVSQIPARGRLAHISRKKYGFRKDMRKAARESLFREIKPLTEEDVLIKSDQNPHYVSDVKKFFPKSFHERFKGRSARMQGQGELKKGGFDPIFTLNHTCAMLRANINRLIRQTWCTTKKKERLELHIAIYALYHNLVLIKS